MYHLHLIKRRHLDERKTLTKVSTRTPLTTIPQTKAHTSERENQEKLMQTARRLVKGPDTAETSKKNLATGEATADPMLGYTRETEVQVDQDTPAQTGTPAETETQDVDIRQTATEPRVVHLTDSDRVITDHRLRTPDTTLGAGHPHATMRNHIDIA